MIPQIRLRPTRLVLAVVLICAACGVDISNQVLLDIPSPAAVRPDQTEAVLLTNFWLPQEVKGLDLGRELAEFWAAELAVPFKMPVAEREVKFDREDIFSDESFWKELAGGRPKSLILTGRAGFSQETHKVLREVDKGSVGESFTREKTWAVRLSFTLETHLYFIAGETGRIVKDKEFKETMTTSNPKQSVLFALHDLLLQLKMKVFRDAFGASRLQERYLLRQ
ncbi:MAG: hypothetical protein A2Y86_09800 [Candidatus Aminicenantes bacterium RBG_13_62_12]|nr:MAG: hypothetical protein A2Y86_09800 [Candidatus Aminicenantes bacterium RBG_13_62_12]